MREIPHTLSRRPSARVLLAWAAILAWAPLPDAYGQMSRSGTVGVVIADSSNSPEALLSAHPAGQPSRMLVPTVPQPLRSTDVSLVRLIFALQARGQFAESAQAISRLNDKLLQGEILAGLYLSHNDHSTPRELLDWLDRYRDRADAPAIYALLLRRLPKGVSPPPSPAAVTLPRSTEVDGMAEDIDPSRAHFARDTSFDRSVLDNVARGNVAGALQKIAGRRTLSSAYAAQLRAEVAQVLFTQNADNEALRVAQLASTGVASVDQASLGFYIGGLAAWRLQRIELARTLFEAGATTTNASARLHAASAFWASRASRSLHDAVAAIKWLHVASEERLTLHGLLARRMLRMDTGIFPNQELMTQADIDAVAATPQGWRAFALLQVGQRDRAESEIRSLLSVAAADPVFGRSLLLVTSAMGWADCAVQIASVLREQTGGQDVGLRFPLPTLDPAGGFSIDPALVYALTRVESNFDPQAVSAVGARGLMQIMPKTARYMMGDQFFASRRLHEPASNLEIGQRYISYLSRRNGIDNDLLRMLVSYNAGPRNLARWDPDIRDHGDPFLFMEAIPVRETRVFVTHALAYSWIYAARLRLPAQSLDELSAGLFPRFTPYWQEQSMVLPAPKLN